MFPTTTSSTAPTPASPSPTADVVTVEVRTRTGWRRLDRRAAPPAIEETDLFELRGLPPGATLRIGPVEAVVEPTGRARVRLMDEEDLRGHLGLIGLRLDGSQLGEIEVLPSKMSVAAYEALRVDLERTWAGLLLDSGGLARLRADLPPPEELWGRIEEPVREIALAPRSMLVAGRGITRLERVRRARDVTPALLRSAASGRPGLGGVLERTSDLPENAMVADTLRRLHTYARRRPDGAAVASATARISRREPFCTVRGQVRSISLGMRADARYRRVLDVWRVLQHPQAAATEGPGELRLGVQGMSRLYEYWVYLQVLLACADRYGPPDPPGYAVLGEREVGGRVRLELLPGTTVVFPGDVRVAFEPEINTRADGWQGIEYTPHPDPDRFQSRATPDVVVYRREPSPWITVIDAKYVGRGFVEAAAARIHEKYARMRVDGEPAVRYVYAAHPHLDLNNRWAGYGHVAMVPGQVIPPLPLPPAERLAALLDEAHLEPPKPLPALGSETPAMPGHPGLDSATKADSLPAWREESQVVDVDEKAPDTVARTEAIPLSPMTETSVGGVAVDPDRHAPKGPVPATPADTLSRTDLAILLLPATVVADQFWMHRQLGGRRIDLGRLPGVVTTSVAESVLVLPPIERLFGFARAAERLGWRLVWTEAADREIEIEALVDEVRVALAAGNRVVVVSGDPSLQRRVRAFDGPVELFDDLDSVPQW